MTSTTAPPVRSASARKLRLPPSLKLLAPFAVLVAIWWAIKIFYALPDRVLVSPAGVWEALDTLIAHGVLIDYASSSLRTIGIATAVSIALGVPTGFALGSSRYFARALEGFLRFFQSVSGISWLPLAIIWFGFTETTILVIVTYTLIVPLTFNTMTGVRAIPANYVLALRSLGAGWFAIVRDVYLPGALPSIVVGLRLGMGYGWRALIAAEMLVRQGGLGDLIFGARTFGQIDRIMAGMVVIGALYILVDRLLIQPVERLTIARWGLLRR